MKKKSFDLFTLFSTSKENLTKCKPQISYCGSACNQSLSLVIINFLKLFPVIHVFCVYQCLQSYMYFVQSYDCNERGMIEMSIIIIVQILSVMCAVLMWLKKEEKEEVKNNETFIDWWCVHEGIWLNSVIQVLDQDIQPTCIGNKAFVPRRFCFAIKHKEWVCVCVCLSVFVCVCAII